MKSILRAIAWLLPLGAAGLLLMKNGVYGYTLFAVIPVALGAFSAMLKRPQTAISACAWGGLGPAVASLALFASGIEGAICIVMCLPLVMPLGALGGYLYFALRRHRMRRPASAMLLFLPLGTFGYDVAAQPPVFPITTTIEIAAPPERIWPHVVSFAAMPDPEPWYFRAGMAYPTDARIEGAGTSAVRYCDFSTGAVVEPIAVWDEPRLLRFRVTQSPEPMREWSFYPHVTPKHLHGYFESREGQFQLVALPNGHTRLVLRGSPEVSQSRSVELTQAWNRTLSSTPEEADGDIIHAEGVRGLVSHHPRRRRAGLARWQRCDCEGWGESYLVGLVRSIF